MRLHHCSEAQHRMNCLAVAFAGESGFQMADVDQRLAGDGEFGAVERVAHRVGDELGFLVAVGAGPDVDR